MRYRGFRFLTAAFVVLAGCGSDAFNNAAGQRSRVPCPANEGDLNVTLSMVQPSEELPDAGPDPADMVLAVAPPLDGSIRSDEIANRLDSAPPDIPDKKAAGPGQPPPMRLKLRANLNGQLVKMQLNQRGFVTGDWGQLRGHIILTLGEDRATKQVRDSAEILLDFDDRLNYEHLVDAITACSGYLDENGQLVNLVQNFRIVWPENMDSFLASFTQQEQWEEQTGSARLASREGRLDDRVKLPNSELARTPEAPYNEPILLQLDVEGNVIVYDEVFPMEVVPNVMLRERRDLVEAGSSAGDATIIIRAHEHCPSGKIRQLIGICAALQFKRFLLRARLVKR